MKSQVMSWTESLVGMWHDGSHPVTPCPECRMRIYVLRNRGSIFSCPLASGGKAVRFGKVKCKPLELNLTPAWGFFPPHPYLQSNQN